jgi:iron complex outermembrane receptor protein
VPIDQTAAPHPPGRHAAQHPAAAHEPLRARRLLNRLGYNTADTITPGFLEIAVRSADAGNRINDIEATQGRISTGIKGVVGGWDYDTAFTYAQAQSDLKVTGYIHESRYIAALATGNLNPFGPNDAAGEALLQGAKMEGDMRSSKSTSTQLDGKVSRDVFKMGGGNAALALGADFAARRSTTRR